MSAAVKSDPAAAVLQWATGLLPGRHAEWGRAMRAELAALVDPAQRRRFAMGCTVAVLRRPAGLWLVAQAVAAAAVLTVGAVLAWAIDERAVRFEALGVVIGLGAAVALLRSRIGFGPPAPERTARLVAAGGVAVVAVEVLLEFHRLRVDPPLMLPMDATIGVFDPERARNHLIALLVVAGPLLVALTGVTARRAAVRPSTITAGGASTAAAAIVWLAVVAVRRELAVGASSAVVASAGAVVGAVVLTVVLTGRSAREVGQAGRPARAGQVLIAGLLAAVGTTSAIGTLMDVLPLTGRWVANNAPPVFAADPPTRVVDSVVVWLPCLLVSLALVAVVRRRPSDA